jgi:uncharacterized protein YprB with RNaseH-like and TPR domain
MINRNPMSKEFQEEAKKRGMSGFQYMQWLRSKLCRTNRTYNTCQKSPQHIKQMLIEKYTGKNLEDVINGKVINTEKGECYHIESQEMIDQISPIDIGDMRSSILDIETLGLSSVPIILIGLARINDNKVLIDQYLPRSTKEEPAILIACIDHLRESDTIITFNGRRFDIPFIEDRLSHHKIEENLYNKIHYDALPLSRSAWKAKLPNCKLGTLEKYILGIEREDDVPSRSVPDFYRTYIRYNNVGPLVPIIDHNKQDLITLAKIFSKLRESKKKIKNKENKR